MDGTNESPADSSIVESTTKSAARFAEALIGHRALPFLFVGSGLSRRYLGLPDWPGLLRVMASEIGEDFDFHLASSNNNLPAAATSLAHAFHPIWWKDERWSDQRQRHQASVVSDEGAIKVAISDYVSNHQALAPGLPGADDDELASELDELRRAVIDGVITTNYDSLPEQIFPSFPVYIGQDELLLSDAQFIGETYKIHGSASAPASLVLTTKDYERFRERNAYLAAKLLTIFAEHPVIFIGYSMNDDYIGEILDEIATAVGSDRYEELGRRIYFVEWNANPGSVPTVEQSTLVRGAARLPVTRIETHSLLWVWQVLSGLERPFPATLIRELRKHVYRLVSAPDPQQSRPEVYTIPIESDTGDLRVIFGVGAFTDKDLENLSSLSARSLQREDIETDLLGLRARGLDAENVLAHGIPEVIRPTRGQYVPVMKYLREAGRVAPDGTVRFEGLPPLIKQLADRELEITDGNLSRFQREVAGKYLTPREVKDSGLPLYFALDCLVLLDPSQYSLEELRAVLIELYEDPQARVAYIESSMRRALCHYDRLAHAASLTVPVATAPSPQQRQKRVARKQAKPTR